MCPREQTSPSVSTRPGTGPVLCESCPNGSLGGRGRRDGRREGGEVDGFKDVRTRISVSDETREPSPCITTHACAHTQSAYTSTAVAALHPEVYP